MYESFSASYYCAAAYQVNERCFLALFSAFGSSVGAGKRSFPVGWLHHEYRERHSLSKSPVFALAPDELFDGGHASDYLLATGGSPLHTKFSHLEALGCYIVYTEPGQVQSHLYACLMDHLACTVLPFNPNFIHFHLDVDGMFLASFVDGKLFLANRFNFHTKDDILYYLATVAEQSGLRLSEHRVSYSGFLRPNTALKKMLSAYIPQIYPIDLSIHGMAFHPAIATELQPMYADMFILPKCGL